MARLRLGRAAPVRDRTPDLALRLAVLLQAGVAPTGAWRFLADSGEQDAAAIADRHGAGDDLGAAIAAQGGRWRPIAAAWRVATEVGAPLAAGLRAIAGALRDADECQDEIRVALAEPASTARLMSWLPLVAVVLGLALGFDTIGVLTTTPMGAACLIAGLSMMGAAHVWTGRLVRAAGPPPDVAGLRAELIAIALTGGVSLERARALADAALVRGDEDPVTGAPDAEQPGARRSARARTDVPASVLASAGHLAPADRLSSVGRRAPDRFARRRVRAQPTPRTPTAAPDDADAEIDRILALSRAAGVPAAEVLRASAAMARQRARTDGRMRAARLSSALLLPLGVCVLPAFILLGVAPMLMGVLSSSAVTV